VARLLADENFPLPTVEELRSCGHDVLSLVETELGGQALEDERVVDLATRDGRAVMTFNRRHFVKLHEVLAGKHAGIVVCSVETDFVRLAHRVHAAIGGQSLAGKLLRIRRDV